MDKRKIEELIFDLLLAVGEDPSRTDLKKTPFRVAQMYEEILSGIDRDPEEDFTLLEEAHDEIVVLKDIKFYSMCEHHLLPFFGMVHIAYLPKGKIVGISKIIRAVQILSHRLQVQERLTMQIADLLEKKLEPLGVMVVMEAEHLCMSMRGVRSPGSKVITSAVRGLFRKDAKSRNEVLSLLEGR